MASAYKYEKYKFNNKPVNNNIQWDGIVFIFYGQK